MRAVMVNNTLGLMVHPSMGLGPLSSVVIIHSDLLSGLGPTRINLLSQAARLVTGRGPRPINTTGHLGPPGIALMFSRSPLHDRIALAANAINGRAPSGWS